MAIASLLSTVREVSLEIGRLRGAEGIANETEIWNFLLRRVCRDAEREVTMKSRTDALTRVAILPDLPSVRDLGVRATRDAIFNSARAEFRAICTGKRADLLLLVGDLAYAAESRIRETIEGDLQKYQAALSQILVVHAAILQMAQKEATDAINGLNDDQLPGFNMVACRRTLSRELTRRFLAGVHENGDAETTFAERIVECTQDIQACLEEHLYLRHAARMEQRLSRNLQGIFPIGTVLAIVGDEKPAWMGDNWVRLEQGIVLVSSGGPGSGFPAGRRGGQNSHSHGTQSYALTGDEMPAHCHALPIFTGGQSRWSNGNVPVERGSVDWGGFTENVGGGRPHTHGETHASSSYPPYLCATFWRRNA
jgi:hypothetical protein